MTRTIVVFLLLLSMTGGVFAQPQPLDPEAAAEAYLARMPEAQRAKSDAYFEGGYWLDLWSFLLGAAVSLVLLFGRVSARVRDISTRLTRFRGVHVFVYFALYMALTSLIEFPLAVYAGYFREHQYDLSNQTFAAWLGDEIKGFGLAIVFGGLAVAGLYAILRRATERWWLYGAIATVLFLAFGALVSPVFINPIFNKYTLLTDERVREPILAMAHANGIDSNNVYVMDSSKQSKRVSANVSGIFGTERVTLNDNLLNRMSLPSIKAVMGHEIGHYALKHVYSMLIYFGIVIVIVFAFLQWGSRRSLERWGERWGLSFGFRRSVAASSRPVVIDRLLRAHPRDEHHHPFAGSRS
jgi:STE24 endopeptidase